MPNSSCRSRTRSTIVSVSSTRSETVTSGCSAWKRAEELRQDALARPGRGADHEQAGELRRLVREALHELLLDRQDALGAAVDEAAGLRRLHLAAGAVDQRLPQALLERADGEGHGGLRDAEHLGCLREGRPVDDGDERRELLGVHRYSSRAG